MTYSQDAAEVLKFKNPFIAVEGFTALVIWPNDLQPFTKVVADRLTLTVRNQFSDESFAVNRNRRRELELRCGRIRCKRI